MADGMNAAHSATQSVCNNCGIKPPRKSWYATECDACYSYRRRTGKHRPLHLIERQVEAELEAYLRDGE